MRIPDYSLPGGRGTVAEAVRARREEATVPGARMTSLLDQVLRLNQSRSGFPRLAGALLVTDL